MSLVIKIKRNEDCVGQKRENCLTVALHDYECEKCGVINLHPISATTVYSKKEVLDKISEWIDAYVLAKRN